MFDIVESYWYKQMSRSISYAILGWSHHQWWPDSPVYQDLLSPEEIRAMLAAIDANNTSP